MNGAGTMIDLSLNAATNILNTNPVSPVSRGSLFKFNDLIKFSEVVKN
jgi:hypothetical protein